MPSASFSPISKPISFSRRPIDDCQAEEPPSSSVEQIRSIDMYQPCRPQRVSSLGELNPPPRPVSSTDDEPPPPIPFPQLTGEFLRYFGRVNKAKIYVTSFRLFVLLDDNCGFHNVPLTMVDAVETRDMFVLVVSCKDGRLFKISSENSENALGWFKLLTTLSAGPRKMDELFAIAYRAWCRSSVNPIDGPQCRSLDVYTRPCGCLLAELRRFGLDDRFWRISGANRAFELCDTYPRELIVPRLVSDDDLHRARDGRSLHRLPVLVWRCRETGSVLLRSSQPRVGLLFWRNAHDENLVEHVINAVTQQSLAIISNGTVGGNVDQSHKLPTGKNMLILDARSYTAAWANRAKGGGFESPEYYQKTEVQFMGLPNIHNIRYSFQQLRQLLTSHIEQATYLQALQGTQWFLFLSNLMSASIRCVDALLVEGRSVLVHCSDGWDRTTQIISLAKLIADQYYRTMTGFKELVERDWVDFGHKFADRHGLLNSDPNERSPVFLQWLDCVHQLHGQFPCAFEFNQLYLAKLAQHVYAGLFGTFLANSVYDFDRHQLSSRTFSIWEYLHPDNSIFRNAIFDQSEHTRLRPRIGVQYCRLWTDIYCSGSDVIQNQTDPRIRTVLSSDIDRSLTRAHSVDSLDNTLDPTLGPSVSNLSSSTLLRTGSESHLHISGVFDDSITRIVVEEIISKVSSQEPSMMEKLTFRNAQDTVDSIDYPLLLSFNENTLVVPAIRHETRQEMMTSTSEISDSTTVGRYSVKNGCKLVSNGGKETTGRRKGMRRKRTTDRMENVLDDDGLTRIGDSVQERMRQICVQHENRVNRLENELQRLRLLLREHQSSMAHYRRFSVENGDGDRPGINKPSFDDGPAFEPRSVDSTASDSWDAIDEHDELPTKWIPDHAVSHCMGCDTKFWAVNRKHHCRSCGKVFCSACSDCELSVPKEQLFEPVRVCKQCYALLADVTHRNLGEDGLTVVG